ncbi:7-carboxy-7-deazaguanine synthase [Limnohabitans sp.]|uniref:7-carboxy-7-deazaguanine synthase n=1 Tax=Limnohabitans sp. TaxID=1907725 RepID=UPI0038B80A6C
MTYSVKEMFYTLQGEGANAGRPAVFCRFAGCNLWSGREEDRSSAICQFCDTDFVGTDGDGGGKFATAQDLALSIAAFWPKDQAHRLVVLTGGEPLLQVDSALVQALHAQDFTIAVETNGTVLPPEGIDWLCVSPKAGSALVVRSGQELKLVYPQAGNHPEEFEQLHFEYHYLQPMDGPHATANTAAAIAYCQSHPQWRLSVQTHKLIGIR